MLIRCWYYKWWKSSQHAHLEKYVIEQQSWNIYQGRNHCFVRSGFLSPCVCYECVCWTFCAWHFIIPFWFLHSLLFRASCVNNFWKFQCYKYVQKRSMCIFNWIATCHTQYAIIVNSLMVLWSEEWNWVKKKLGFY